jgi:colanic acid/amylovoran biosynthesis protein
MIKAVPTLFVEYLRADAIIGVYGDAFTWKNPLQSFNILNKLYLDFIIKLLMINLARKPLVIFPSSLGPFKRRFDRFFIRVFLNRAKVIMVREPISRNNLLEIGVDTARIYEAPDVAFILPSTASEQSKQLLESKNQCLIVGINVSQLLTFENKAYLDLMVKVADYLSTDIGATVVLIPHEIFLTQLNEIPLHSDKIGGDDIVAVKKVYEKVKNKHKMIAITNEVEGDIIKGIIGQCDLFIGARTHSIIAALSMGVPTIGIAYSQKTPGIMRMVGLEKYVCNFSTLTIEELVLKINDMLSKRNDVRRDLLAEAETLKKKVWEMGDFVPNFGHTT